MAHFREGKIYHLIMNHASSNSFKESLFRVDKNVLAREKNRYVRSQGKKYFSYIADTKELFLGGEVDIIPSSINKGQDSYVSVTAEEANRITVGVIFERPTHFFHFR